MLGEEPIWLTEKLVLTIHSRQLAEHGGLAGVRDAGMLSSALARPRHLYAFGGSEVDLAHLAASYAFGVARNHPFVDGNKRTAYVVFRIFLRLNKLVFSAPQTEKYFEMLKLAEGNISEEEFAEWIRENSIET